MKLTTDILWDYLLPIDLDAKVYNCIHRKAAFSSVRQHPNKEKVFIENAIYVVGYEKYQVINSQPEIYNRNTFIFVNEEDDPDFRPTDCTVNAFVIMNESIMDIFTQVSDLNVEFQYWGDELNQALIENRSLKDLVDIGQKYIINPFIILDEALNLVSFTNNIHEDDETFQATIEKGFTPPDLISTIMAKRGAKGKNLSEEGIYKDEAIVPYEEINQPILVDGRIVANLCMHCSIVKFTAGANDVLVFFAEKVSYFFRRNEQKALNNDAENERIGQFLAYVLNHDLDSQEMELMADAAEFPVHARFHLYALEPKVPIGLKYLFNRVKESLLQEKCFVHQNRVYVIFTYIWKNQSADEHIEFLEKQLESVMKENDCYCSSAREFSRFFQFKDAVTQANAALRLGRRILQNDNPVNNFEWRQNDRDRIFTYDEFSMHHVIETCAKELPLKSMCCPQILDILEHDQKKGTDNYKVLYTYLENDRVTSDAANLLHMHRNNVNYRIKRMEEMFHINLADNEERLRIQMTFRMLDLMSQKELLAN